MRSYAPKERPPRRPSSSESDAPQLQTPEVPRHEATASTLHRAVDEATRQGTSGTRGDPGPDDGSTERMPAGHEFSRISVSGETTPRAGVELRVSAPGDAAEVEAENVAQRMTRLPSAQPAWTSGSPGAAESVRSGSEGQLLRAASTPSADAAHDVAPAAAHEALQSSGHPLEPETRDDFQQRFGHDFSRVRVHTDERAGAATQQLRARAFTHGSDIVFAPGEYAPSTQGGRTLLAHELTHVVQQADASAGAVRQLQRAPAAPTAPAGAEPAIESAEVPTADKKDEELAVGILRTQSAILESWDTALANFHVVLTSSSDKEAETDFAGVIQKFFTDQIMGTVIKQGGTATAGIVSVLDGLVAEAKRAAAAKSSGSLRAFLVQHKTAIGRLQMSTLAIEDDFRARVRRTREQKEEAESGGSARKGKKGSQGSAATENVINEYYLMRFDLENMLTQLDYRLKISTPEALFLKLSEEWIRQNTVRRFGEDRAARIRVRLAKDYSVTDAHIEGAGGQKLAEQLLKDARADGRAGVDVLHINAPKLFTMMGDNGYPAWEIHLDASNRDVTPATLRDRTHLQAVLNLAQPIATKIGGD